MGERGSETAVEDVPLSRIRPIDTLGEILAGLLQRPGRMILTMLGPLLGIGAFVAVMGLTATASGQISAAFSALSATQVTVTDAGTPDAAGTVNSFPADADAIVGRLNGVVSAGVSWSLPGNAPVVSTSLDPRVTSTTLSVTAASPGYLDAAQVRLDSGVPISDFENRHALRVALLGRAAARQLGITSLTTPPSVVVDSVPFTVIGIIDRAPRASGLLGSVVIPTVTAAQIWGNPSSLTPATMLVRTQLGAADLIAGQAALALRPDDPAVLKVTPPPKPLPVQGTVTNSLAALFLALAGVVLVIGATGIANTTLIAVIERTPEIGLRRAIGARRRDIAAQFLGESAAIGAIGGLIGSALGTLVVVVTALAHSWTAIMNPWITASGPLLGALVGVLAGVYPALRAANIPPATALKR